MSILKSVGHTEHSLYRDYIPLINRDSQRARLLRERELLCPDYVQRDHQEACSVAKFYLTALKGATSAFLKGTLEHFDGTIGDDSCQVLAAYAISAYLDDDLHAEATRLNSFATDALKRLNSFTNKATIKGNSAPLTLIEQNKFETPLSERMDYLVRAFILNQGTLREQKEDGDITLKVVPQQLQNQFSKKLSSELLARIIISAKEHMNQDSLKAVQQFARTLPQSEADLLADGMTQLHVTPRAERLHCSCAFFNVKATLSALADQGTPFMITRCGAKKEITDPVFFKMDATHKMRMIAKEDLSPSTPVLVIEAIFNRTLSRETLLHQVEEYDLMRYALANIAVYPQFIPTQETFQDQDLTPLPAGPREEIQKYRTEGTRLRCKTKEPELMSIIHTYATTI